MKAMRIFRSKKINRYDHESFSAIDGDKSLEEIDPGEVCLFIRSSTYEPINYDQVLCRHGLRDVFYLRHEAGDWEEIT